LCTTKLVTQQLAFLGFGLELQLAFLGFGLKLCTVDGVGTLFVFSSVICLPLELKNNTIQTLELFALATKKGDLRTKKATALLSV
jgi:hypothetical protein